MNMSPYKIGVFRMCGAPGAIPEWQFIEVRIRNTLWQVRLLFPQRSDVFYLILRVKRALIDARA